MSKDNETQGEFRFQDLPGDLIYSVFEAAADDAEKPNWNCALVSKRVKTLVEPMLYRHIVLNTYKGMELLHRTIVYPSSKPSGFFSTHVKTLEIGACSSWPDVFDILSAVPHLSALYFRIKTRDSIEHSDLEVGRHPVWEVLKPKRLCIANKSFLPSHRHFHTSRCGNVGASLNPLFTNVTHLELPWGPPGESWACPSLSQLTTLTHLCFSAPPTLSGIHDAASDIVKEAIPHFPIALIVCVFSIPFTQWFVNARELVEATGGRLHPRVVVAVSEYYYNSILGSEWIKKRAIWRVTSVCEGRLHEDAFWERAEAKVREQILEEVRVYRMSYFDICPVDLFCLSKQTKGGTRR
ncbi:hypothetical protein DFP72DRAFT_164565 [Ephemerocybe angulata]|uniref:F-box domain-containing protein n=1 Tax=Ephemerocybe angulata TaxID=980116 RepID=A0A8H6MAJ3_9AGAR|nr:hypothetical protein DFP72DRAFT_164565 [Tulosesus angulatus]